MKADSFAAAIQKLSHYVVNLTLYNISFDHFALKIFSCHDLLRKISARLQISHIYSNPEVEHHNEVPTTF